ncbi:MAG: FxsA family protein [Gammaproteobacteria bacterium]|nr:FxsA family protein [Gammaproteobacteria bacterium]
MNMFRIMLLLFISVPILEIYLLFSVSKVIGSGNTVLLVILTAVIGTMLLRSQGLATLQKAQNALTRGEMPAEALLEGVLLLLGGALLLTPGFFTDALGFACLLPYPRRLLARWAGRHINTVQAVTPKPGQRRPSHDIEREYRREDD